MYFLLLSFIRNEIISGTSKVGEISKKVQESRLKCYGQESGGDGGAGEKLFSLGGCYDMSAEVSYII